MLGKICKICGSLGASEGPGKGDFICTRPACHVERAKREIRPFLTAIADPAERERAVEEFLKWESQRD